MDTAQMPISVTIISWLLIVTSAFTLLYTPFSFNNQATRGMIHALEVSPLTVILLSFFGGFVNLTAGVAMLKKLRWGRQLYLIVTPLFLLLTIVLYHFKLLAIFLMGFVMYAVFFVLLTRRPVSDFFSNSIVIPSTSPRSLIEPNGQPDRTGKKIASVILLVPGGMMLNAWFMVIVPMSNYSLLGVIFISAIFCILACIFTVPAIFLLGEKAMDWLHRCIFELSGWMALNGVCDILSVFYCGSVSTTVRSDRPRHDSSIDS